MKCDYCKQSYEHLNTLILPYVYNDNEKIIKSKEVHLCNDCFKLIRNKYELYLTPYTYEALLTLTMLNENMFFDEAKK